MFAQRTRIPTSARSIGFCDIWVCYSNFVSVRVRVRLSHDVLTQEIPPQEGDFSTAWSTTHLHPAPACMRSCDATDLKLLLQEQQVVPLHHAEVKLTCGGGRWAHARTTLARRPPYCAHRRQCMDQQCGTGVNLCLAHISLFHPHGCPVAQTKECVNGIPSLGSQQRHANT